MSLSMLLLMGLFGVLLIVLSKRPIIGMFGENNKLVNMLKSAIDRFSTLYVDEFINPIYSFASHHFCYHRELLLVGNHP